MSNENKHNYLDSLKQKTKEELINDLYNYRISSLADFNADSKHFDDTNTGKRIPYIGWFWRDADFVGKQISIGRTGNGYIGVMENNKWGYPERLMTEQEVSMFVDYLEQAFLERCKGRSVSQMIANSEKMFAEMRKWFQSLMVEG